MTAKTANISPINLVENLKHFHLLFLSVLESGNQVILTQKAIFLKKITSNGACVCAFFMFFNKFVFCL